MAYKSSAAIPTARVEAWRALNGPLLEINLFGDTECREFLRLHFEAHVVERFEFIRHGPIKADFFRAHYLYRKGGVYADVDMVPLLPIDQFVDRAKDAFLMPLTDTSVSQPFNPTFVAVRPQHPFMEVLCSLYSMLPLQTYSYWSWSIVTLTTAMDEFARARTSQRLREQHRLDDSTKHPEALHSRAADFEEMVIRDQATGAAVLRVRDSSYDIAQHAFLQPKPG